MLLKLRNILHSVFFTLVFQFVANKRHYFLNKQDKIELNLSVKYDKDFEKMVPVKSLVSMQKFYYTKTIICEF